MYVFGGRGVDGKDLEDLAAFKISSQSHSRDERAAPSDLELAPCRSSMVYVPKHGPGSIGSIRPCDGDVPKQGICPRR